MSKTLKRSWIIGGSTGSSQLSPVRARFTPLLPKSAVQGDMTLVIADNNYCNPINNQNKYVTLI
ncbi:MAG: hypothetical protein NC191_07940 [Muribaculaceae bacterium]|nr:hypothetical protein [Muribaculaceae bacterium]